MEVKIKINKKIEREASLQKPIAWQGFASYIGHTLFIKYTYTHISFSLI